MANNNTSQLNLSQLLTPPYLANPYPFYSQLRSQDPIFWDEQSTAWVLTRYSDAASILRDPRFSAARLNIGTEWIPEESQAKLAPPVRALSRQMLFLDPPDHTRLRGLVSKAFTPRVVESLRPRIQQLVDELLDTVQSSGHMNFIQDFAYPLPAIVIAEMLGVPPEDRTQFTRWTSDFANLLDEGKLSFEDLLQSLAGVSEFMDYFREIIRQRRIAPREDLLQAMIVAEEQGDKLNEEELLSNCVLLLAAGHGTTTHLLGNGLLALLRNPDQLARWKNDPSLASFAVAELLRYDSPVQLTSRHPLQDIEVGGKRIEEGQETIIVLGAANHDPAQFSHPDQLDLGRPENRLMSFGLGIHFCLGAPLARLEAEIAFNTILRRLQNLQLATEEIEWAPSIVFRGLIELPLAFTL
ncbi:MAG: cytochrome P450 [Ktedonobacteraceae bacterium]|nr:cytochrome P450 [Ktedonobacteraceae bacterium]